MIQLAGTLERYQCYSKAPTSSLLRGVMPTIGCCQDPLHITRTSVRDLDLR